MAELVKIPIASAEYVAQFDRPYLRLIADERLPVVEAIVAALRPFNFRLSNTEIVNSGNPAEHKIIFRIPERGIAFQFSAEQYSFSKEQSSWATAAEDAQVLHAAQTALLTQSSAKVALCLVTLAMHIQPLNKSRDEILAPFLPVPYKTLFTGRKVQTFASHFKWEDGDVLLDFSVTIANGVYMRLSSQFQGQPPLEEMLTKIRNDQNRLFDVLGIEEALNA